MEVLFLLLPLSLAMAAGGLACFIWAARDGQFEDLTGPAEQVAHEAKREALKQKSRRLYDEKF